MTSLLQINNLNIIDSHSGHKRLNELSLTVYKNRTLAIVGESGSGKSLLTKAILGLLPNNLYTTGDIVFQQQPLTQLTPKQWQKIRGKQISLIVQNAMGAFDPLMTIGAQFSETLNCHLNLPAEKLQQTIGRALHNVKLDHVHNLLDSYPNQLSGGQLQRVMIAFALSLEPEIIIADEPTTALDAITQYEIMQQFKKLANNHACTLIFITHDLGLVQEIADDIAVIKDGKLVEYATTAQLFNAPQQRYTQFLLQNRHQLTERFEKIMRKRDVINR